MTTSSNVVSKIMDEAVGTASVAEYCRNCDLCYIRENEEFGYCRKTSLVVKEFYSCQYHKRKEVKKRI